MNGCNVGETALDTGVELSEDDKESLILGTGMHQWALKEREAAETQRAQNVAELRREVVAEAERTKSNLAEVENALASAKAE
ncbi:unnamed protein product, partial [Symbiodinium microadriaticum]